GIGYISYNALPGWHMRGMVRDMMLYHIGRFAGSPAQHQITQARELLDFLVRGLAEDKNFYGTYMRYELDWVKQTADGYFFHDHLEGDNNAFYFFQFCDDLRQKKLRYLGEAKFSDMSAMNVPPAVAQTIAQMAPGQLEREQYLDFLRNRVFRQSLV